MERVEVLELLDKLDEFRRTHQDERQHPSDYCMRVMEAIVASAGGFSGRADWTEHCWRMIRRPTADISKTARFFMDDLDGGRNPAVFFILRTG